MGYRGGRNVVSSRIDSPAWTTSNGKPPGPSTTSLRRTPPPRRTRRSFLCKEMIQPVTFDVPPSPTYWERAQRRSLGGTSLGGPIPGDVDFGWAEPTKTHDGRYHDSIRISAPSSSSRSAERWSVRSAMAIVCSGATSRLLSAFRPGRRVVPAPPSRSINPWIDTGAAPTRRGRWRDSARRYRGVSLRPVRLRGPSPPRSPRARRHRLRCRRRHPPIELGRALLISPPIR